MKDSTTLTIRLSGDTKSGLAEPASRTRLTSSFLAAEAIAGYVERELAIVEAVERGRADTRAGRVIPHDDVMREASAAIEDVRAKPSRGGRARCRSDRGCGPGAFRFCDRSCRPRDRDV